MARTCDDTIDSLIYRTLMIKYSVSKKDWVKVKRLALQAQRKNQGEICGALVLGNHQRLKLVFLKNRSEAPGQFMIALPELRLLRKKLPAFMRLVGIFHSHPISEAVPSKEDLRQAPLRSLMLIYDVCGREAKLWRITGSKRHKRYSERHFVLR